MTSDHAPFVLAAGYVTLDIVNYRGLIWHAAGGTAGNVAAILALMGWRSSIMADVGDDLAGREVRDDLKQANVSVDSLRLRSGTATPRLIHEIDESGHRYHFKCPTCHRSFPMSRPLRKDRARELLQLESKPDVFFFDRLNAGTLLLAEHFASEGSTVIFEPSRPAQSALSERALDAATVVKQSSTRYSGLDDLRPRSRQIRIITEGQNGARFRVGGGAWHHSDAIPYPTVDAGGAGDWTTGALIHMLRLDENLTVKKVGAALRQAQALAALSCGAPGARGLARQQSGHSLIELAKHLERGRKRLTTGETRPQAAVGKSQHNQVAIPTERLLPKRPKRGSRCHVCLQITHEPESQDSSTNG